MGQHILMWVKKSNKCYREIASLFVGPPTEVVSRLGGVKYWISVSQNRDSQVGISYLWCYVSNFLFLFINKKWILFSNQENDSGIE